MTGFAEDPQSTLDGPIDGECPAAENMIATMSEAPTGVVTFALVPQYLCQQQHNKYYYSQFILPCQAQYSCWYLMKTDNIRYSTSLPRSFPAT